MSKILLDHLRASSKTIETQTRALLARAEAEVRDFTPAEEAEFDKNCADLRAITQRVKDIVANEEQERTLEESFRKLGGRLDDNDQRSGGATTRNRVEWAREDGRNAVVAAEQRFADHPVVAEYAQRNAAADQSILEAHGGLGPYLRALSTTGASAVIPTVWASDLIDRARNYAAVLQAGAQIVPMESKTLQIARLTGDPTARFRTEGSTISPSDPTLDNVTLTATTLSTLVVANLEWFQDADNSSAIVTDAIAKAIGLELDLVSLFGGLSTGAEVGATGINRSLASPNPTGILAGLLAQASSSVLGGATNGTTQTAATPWDEVIDTVLTPADYNETSNALIWSPRMARRYAKQYDTTYQPLQRPAVLDGVQVLQSNQIPSNLTQGTSTTNMSDLFAGDFTKLLIGQRMQITVQTLTERYAESGQIGFVAHWRGDVQMARPRAFAVYRYLKNT